MSTPPPCVCSGLYHPHVVQMHAIVRTQHFLCIVMELANGGDVFRLVKSSGGLPEPAARFIFQQLALTLSYLHSAGMYIRDVKPSNLLIFWNASGMPILKITDFNLAKDTASQARRPPAPPPPAAACSFLPFRFGFRPDCQSGRTISFAAPEQLDDSLPSNRRSGSAPSLRPRSRHPQ